MTEIPRVLLLVSAAALALGLAQPGLAGEESAAGAGVSPAPVTTPEAVVVPVPESAPAATAEVVVPAAAPAPEAAAAETAAEAAQPAAQAPEPTAEVSRAEQARAKADARRAEMEAERNERYRELRERAAEVGLELPETPPWESAQAAMPEMPHYGGPSTQQREAMRQRYEAMREKMKSMTPEERKAMREAHWKQMRERAAERGMEMPETPPWEEAEKRYKEAQERFENYRRIVDEMTTEQLEAARAVFGSSENMQQQPQAMLPMPPIPPQMPQGGGYGYGPQGGSYPGYGPYQGGPASVGGPPMPYFEGRSIEQGPPPPRGGAPY